MTFEWRVRFDISNPASSGMRHYPVTSDSFWDAIVKRAISMGHGIRDIADVAAHLGEGAGAAMATVRRARPAMQAIGWMPQMLALTG